ncbi:uncharacterized protein LOC112053960 [Bicyclus anynana]|uniref:Uncharacterized protein LOC112053960 n=1 Tax=Bicyclus anynana TaxID=110368 RepID=A0A6J1NRD8_BICAN|nr:uncharacterized protein LOC112053960 [Bicyclus anynana]
MNWDNSTILKFLELYRSHSCIWDPKHKGHKNRQCLDEAWLNIKEDLGMEYSVQELKRKKESLMSAYRGYRKKIKRSEDSVSDPSDVYQPTWFAYSFMDSFLGPVYTCFNTTKVDDECHVVVVENSESNDVYEEEEYYTEQSTSSPQHYQPSNEDNTPAASRASKRRQHDPLELSQQSHMEQTFKFVKNMYELQAKHRFKHEDDECSVFGLLIAKKLRRLSEDRRDVLMVKINQLFIDERRDSSAPNSNSTL